VPQNSNEDLRRMEFQTACQKCKQIMEQSFQFVSISNSDIRNGSKNCSTCGESLEFIKLISDICELFEEQMRFVFNILPCAGFCSDFKKEMNLVEVDGKFEATLVAKQTLIHDLACKALEIGKIGINFKGFCVNNHENKLMKTQLSSTEKNLTFRNLVTLYGECRGMLKWKNSLFYQFSNIERCLCQITVRMDYISDSREELILGKWIGLDDVSKYIGCFFNSEEEIIRPFKGKKAIGWYLKTY